MPTRFQRVHVDLRSHAASSNMARPETKIS